MRRLQAPAVAVWVVLILSLALAPAVLADERDPRCAAWEAGAPPPGIDMAVVCPSAGGIATAEFSLEREPLMPYIVGLIVMALVLTVFGFVAMRLTAKPARDPRAADGAWWTCVACGSTNQPGRASCYACQASRSEPAPTHPV